MRQLQGAGNFCGLGMDVWLHPAAASPRCGVDFPCPTPFFSNFLEPIAMPKPLVPWRRRVLQRRCCRWPCWKPAHSTKRR